MSALPKLFAPEDEPDVVNVRVLERDVAEGRRCVECLEEYESAHARPPVICVTCANAYLTKLLDQLGYTLRRTRGLNAEGHARIARQRKTRNR